MIDILKVLPPTDKKLRISYKRRLVWQRPSYRAKRAEIQPRMNAASKTPEARAKRLKKLLITLAKPEVSKKRSAITSDANRRRWSDPEKRAQLCEVAKNHPSRIKQWSEVRRKGASPEVQAKRTAGIRAAMWRPDQVERRKRIAAERRAMAGT